MKLFKEQIFMGNGDSSSADCYELNRQLNEALEIISGLQQISSDRHDHPDYYKLLMLADNICIALTGGRLKL